MRQSLKLTAYWAAKKTGFFARAAASDWRRRRLAILCYHGVSLRDEHHWNPHLYITPDLLRRRLELLRRSGCNLLPLDDAVERLRQGTLPPHAVALTFDDGFYDFYRQAAPVLREYRAPATVYVCTYYSWFNRPVFDPMLDYLLWKGAGKMLAWPEILDREVSLNAGNLAEVRQRLYAFASGARLSAADKDALLAELSGRLRVDYGEICRSRVLQLMNPDELRDAAAQGFDLQLHTHRHRMPVDGDLFIKEVEDNRAALSRVREGAVRHFCYPSGVYYAQSGELLGRCGVVSATTCEPGLVSASTNPFYLNRYSDDMLTHDLVFEACTSGVAWLLPHRSGAAAPAESLPAEIPASSQEASAGGGEG